MRFIIQRVKEASVTVEKQIVSQINTGLLVLVGLTNSDLNDSNNISDQTNNGKQILNKLNFRQKLVTKKEQCCK